MIVCPVCPHQSENNLLMEEHIWEAHRISIVLLNGDAPIPLTPDTHAEAVEILMNTIDWRSLVANEWFARKVGRIGM